MKSTIAFAGAVFIFALLVSNYAHALNNFDLESRNLFRDPSPKNRNSISLGSDILQYGLIAAPLLFDTYHLIAKTGGKRNWRPLVGDAAAFAVTFGLTTLAKEFLSRDRPFVQECANENTYDPGCNTATQRKSFFSGHTAMAFTGAGLLCSSNMRTVTLGDEVCIVALGAAATTGVFRVAADKHYATDVITGAAVGLASGLLMPKLIEVLLPVKVETPEAEAPKAAQISVTPMIGASVYGGQVNVRF